MTSRKRSYKRGYPVAVLIGFEEKHAAIWNVFSEVVKPHATLELQGRRTEENCLYDFHESIVNALRPILKEGVKSIVTAAPARTNYAKEFVDHVRRHHAWLVQGKGSGTAVFGELVGSACTLAQVADLVKAEAFRKLVSETTSGEADLIVSILEKRLSDTSGNTTVLFSLDEIEELICGPLKKNRPRPQYLMITDRYLTESKEKNRIHRLLQISKNRNTKTRIIKADTPAGKRLSQFGGLACFTECPE